MRLSFEGKQRRLIEFAFEVYGEINGVPNNVTPTATLKIYARDGTDFEPTPGRLLYYSSPIILTGGYKTYKLSNVDLDIPASHIIWTVQFDGLEGVNGSQAALILSVTLLIPRLISREQEVVMMISGKKMLMAGNNIKRLAMYKWKITSLLD